jgi:outer membrane immunogenic protein
MPRTECRTSSRFHHLKVYRWGGDVKRIVTAALMTAVSISAHAADLPVKAPTYKAPVAAIYDWTGFYVGVNAGLGVGRDLTTINTPATNFTESSHQSPFGALGGVQAGYNWQAAHWVFGVEADFQGADLHDNYTCVSSCIPARSITFDQRIDWFGTARARLGYASGPVLTYVTGGFAYANVKDTIANTFVPFGGLPPTTVTTANQEVRTGYAIGSGVEASLGGNWTGKLEYLYLDLGSRSTTIGANTFGYEYREHIFRGGLNYRIGAPDSRAAAIAMNWSGFYLGANGGTGLGRGHSELLFASLPHITLSPLGFIGGVQGGYNWQASNWVFGVEADIQGSTMQDDKACVFNCNAVTFAHFDQRLPWLGTVRGRIGYAAGSNLFYATGGLAYGEVKTRIFSSFGGANTAEISNTRTGWTAGAGIETPFELFGLFGRGWTSKTEYLYVDLGGATTPFTNNGVTTTFATNTTEHIFRTGLNYHFNQPIVAKY